MELALIYGKLSTENNFLPDFMLRSYDDIDQEIGEKNKIAFEEIQIHFEYQDFHILINEKNFESIISRFNQGV